MKYAPAPGIVITAQAYGPSMMNAEIVRHISCTGTACRPLIAVQAIAGRRGRACASPHGRFRRPPSPHGCVWHRPFRRANRPRGWGKPHPWSFYICRAHYLRIPLPSSPWGRGWIASGAFISRCEKGAPRSACRGGEGVLSGRLIRMPPVATTRRPRFLYKQFRRLLGHAVRSTAQHHAACSVSDGVWRSSSAFWICALVRAKNAWCDRDARPSWFPPCPRLLTPSSPSRPG